MRNTTHQQPNDSSDIQVVRLSEPAGEAHNAAWVEIETGRYQPRRIRGSFRGRELG